MDKKRIKILTTGTIRVKNLLLNGPVLTPYFEKIDTIFALISSGVKVVEVCDDGVEIALDISNFSEDNSVDVRNARVAEQNAKKEAAELAQMEKEQKLKDKKEKKAKETKEVAEAVKKEAEETKEVVEVAEAETKVDDNEDNNAQNYRNNNKHNKHNKNNKYNNSEIKIEEPITTFIGE